MYRNRSGKNAKIGMQVREDTKTRAGKSVN